MKIQTVKKHLLTGVSYMIPVVVTGGICMAIAKVFGGAYVASCKGTIPYVINQIGTAAMLFVIPVLTAGIAYSIAERPGIIPGLILGYIANDIKAGFLGGILAAFLIGYLINYMKKMKLPKALKGLMPVLIIPVISALVIGLAFYQLLGNPIASIQNSIVEWMKSLQGGSRFVLGTIIGGMMGFDLGGPINKTASLFCNALMVQGIYGPEAAKIVGGMVPPLGVALAVLISGRKKYTQGEIETAKTAIPLGLCFITEGVLPFAASDPLRIIPASVIGSAVASGLVMVWNVTSTVPHGGIFVVPIMEHPLYFLLALTIGSCVTAAILYFLKPSVKAGSEEIEDESQLDSIDIKF
jgi:PTS system fructose-specific IIC component